ncbi:hypothetical protein PanWU01x14_032500 [Parasponia andersonii]|uniref:Uncharacterized protein n=1 Tax=Parasponia andersonii TaxID=3476 RepID=A0A2P5DUF8_PARAD|nr:hypothetical protein PanWU01x14_032500 [Parasponia andersonii]
MKIGWLTRLSGTSFSYNYRPREMEARKWVNDEAERDHLIMSKIRTTQIQAQSESSNAPNFAENSVH